MTNLEGLKDNPLYQKGVQHVQRKEWAEASQCFERLRTEYPDLRGLDLPSIHARLRASVRNGEAARTFEDVLSLAPNNEAARQGLAWAKGLADQAAMYDEAIRYLKEKRY